MDHDWSTIRLCNSCGRAVDGKATACEHCQGSGLGPAAPGILTTGGNDFGRAARDLRRLGPSYVVLAIPWAMLAVLTAVTFRLPVEGLLKLDNMQTLGRGLRWPGAMGGLLIVLGGAWQSWMLFRLAKRVSIKEWRESVDKSAIYVVLATVMTCFTLGTGALDAGQPGQHPEIPIMMGVFFFAWLYCGSQCRLARGCEGIGAIFSNDSLRAHARQAMREWKASAGCLALLLVFMMMAEERAGQFVIIRILALLLTTLITYTIVNTVSVLRRTARVFEDATMGRVASAAASLTSNAPAP